MDSLSKIFFYFLIFSIGSSCFAQNLNDKIFKAEVFSSENGLSSSRVTVNFVDSRGYLWVGTVDGLHRYDGYDFIVFKYEPGDTLSISNNYISCIEEDKNGDLWIGTNDGLNIFDRQLGIFRRFILKYSDEEINKSNKIDEILPPDSLGLWVQIENSLKRINLRDHSLRSFDFYEGIFDSNKEYSTSGLIMDANGLIWLGTNNGLFVINPLNESYVKYSHDSKKPYSLRDNNINDVFIDANDEIWVATDNGLSKFDRLQDRFISYDLIGSHPTKLKINKIVETENGTVWLATNLGLANLNKSSKTIIIHPQIIFQENIINLSSLKTLEVDRNNILWLGSDMGLIKIDLKPRKFDPTDKTAMLDLNLKERNVTTVYKDRAGRIWIGDASGNLEIFDTKKAKTTNLNLENTWVKTIFEDNKGRIWIGCSSGIYLFTNAQNKLIPFEEYFHSVVGSDLRKVSISQIIQGNREDFWIGTNKGLSHFKEKVNMVDSYNSLYNDKTSIKVGSVNALCSNQGNEIWIGTQQGVFVFNTQTNVFYKPDFGLHDNSILDEIVIYSILMDNDSIWWFGTNYGLLSINSIEGIKNHYTEKNGLPNNSVFKLLQDSESNIWFSTNRGLVKFDKSKMDFLRYGLNDGLQSNEYNPGCGYSSDNGDLFFGGLGGVDWFYPHELIYYNSSPQVMITSLEVYGQNAISTRFIDQNIHSVIVRYNETFNMHFSLMDFSFPKQNRFMYSISPVGKKGEWLPIGNQKSITFSNLPSGTYNFKVKGSSGDGIWSDNEASLKIIVEAPFWKTEMALFLYGISILLLFYLFIQFRTKSLRESNRILRDSDIVAKEVSRQKELLSNRNKNIEDSLNYAQRIQQAILVKKENFKQILPNSFVLHMPKDIVSGDFYWIFEKDDKVFIAAVDCTGHGVPGAFMSLIGLELFRKISNLPNIENPGTFLNHLNDNIQEIFGYGGNISLRDGMDMALCVIDKKNMSLQFAGAMNPLFLIRDDKLIEIKGDRFSIGADVDNEDTYKKNFSSHKIDLQKNDMLYMFSDGFADQFGGPAGKKYKYRRFRHLLLTIYNIDINRQEHYLQDSIADWMGNEEQIDDILVIGIKADF